MKKLNRGCPLFGALAAALLGACLPASWGAGALLHPGRKLAYETPRLTYESVVLDGDGVQLKGWWFHARPPARGTLVYLHGSADNRSSGLGIAERFVPRGFDVIAYDSRAHGESTGDACTYGYYEKIDLQRVLDRITTKPIVLMGTSLGGAVALQTAAIDARVAGVVAVATFSDLRIVANERAPFFASQSNVDHALALAERQACFSVDDTSPRRAAPGIRVPVLLIHGAADDKTPPAHSQRVFQALTAEKSLVLVPGAGHDNALNGGVWPTIDAWVETIAAR